VGEVDSSFDAEFAWLDKFRTERHGQVQWGDEISIQ